MVLESSNNNNQEAPFGFISGPHTIEQINQQSGENLKPREKGGRGAYNTMSDMSTTNTHQNEAYTRPFVDAGGMISSPISRHHELYNTNKKRLKRPTGIMTGNEMGNERL